MNRKPSQTAHNVAHARQAAEAVRDYTQDESPADADTWEHRDVLGYVRAEIEATEGE